MGLAGIGGFAVDVAELGVGPEPAACQVECRQIGFEQFPRGVEGVRVGYDELNEKPECSPGRVGYRVPPDVACAPPELEVGAWLLVLLLELELLVPVDVELEPVLELEPVDLLVLVLDVDACVEPGSATATAAAAATLANPTVAVAAFSRRRPRSRSAMACAMLRDARLLIPRGLHTTWTEKSRQALKKL